MGPKVSRALRHLRTAVIVASLAVASRALFIRPPPIVVHRAVVQPERRIGPPGFHTMAKRALCLSGGGYRAVAFDVGALWRLNELGALKNIDFVSSVSGGSIVSAYVVLHWRELEFDPITGVATNFPHAIAEPLLNLTRHSAEVWPLVSGLLTTSSVAEQMAKSYDRELFNHATLADIPSFDATDKRVPRLVINATRLEDGSLWTFGQDGITAALWPTEADDARTGDDRSLPVAVAVAASAAFPPFLSPLTLDMREVVMPPADLKAHFRRGLGPTDVDADRFLDKYVPAWTSLAERVSLVDGGVLNNAGTEWCWGSEATLVVSAALPERTRPVGRSWFHILSRVLNTAS